MTSLDMANGLIYDLLGWGIFFFGVLACIAMWRNAVVWKGRKQVLRFLSGLTCAYLAIFYLVLSLVDIPDVAIMATLLVRPGLFAMVVLAFAFSYADA